MAWARLRDVRVWLQRKASCWEWLLRKTSSWARRWGRVGGIEFVMEKEVGLWLTRALLPDSFLAGQIRVSGDFLNGEYWSR